MNDHHCHFRVRPDGRVSLEVAELRSLAERFISLSTGVPDELRDPDGALLRMLMRAAANLSPEIRKLVCVILGLWLKQRDADHCPDLIVEVETTIAGLMAEDTNQEVRWSAVVCSQGLCSPIPHLLAAARDRSARVRFQVAFALGCFMATWYLGEMEQFHAPVGEALLDLLHDVDEQVREQAAYAFGQGGHDGFPVRQRLWEAQDDPDPGVRGAAASSLVAFGDPGARAAVQRLLQANELASSVFHAARQLADPSLDELVQHASRRFDLQQEEAET